MAFPRFAHPRGRKWEKRKPEQEVQIGPKNSAAYLSRGMQHVVMIVPVDADVDET